MARPRPALLALTLLVLLGTTLAALVTDTTRAATLGVHPLARAANVLTVRVDQPALVSLPSAALAAAGWPVASLDPAMVQVYRGGTEVPALRTLSGGQLSSVQFLAAPSERPSTREAVYWLVYGQSQGLSATLPTSPSTPITWEADQVYQPALATERGDSWFGLELRQGQAASAISLTLPTSIPAGSSAVLSVGALTRRGGHRLTLYRGGAALGSATWDDPASGATSPTQVTITVNQGIPAGAADLALALDSAGSPADIVLVDRLAFPDVTRPLPTLSPTPLRQTPRDLALGPESVQGGADYLIITHSSLRPALDPLIALKRAQGQQVGVVEAQWAYDAWSFGERDPEAIRSLIRVAAAQWSPRPRAVLLVGAGTVRMRGGVTTTGTQAAPPDQLALAALATPDAATLATLPTEVLADPLIPPYLVRGVDPLGEIGCDTCYTRLDTESVLTDPTPDISIGRLPARTLDEAQILVSKTVGYQTAPPPGAWRTRVAVLTDNDVQEDGTPDTAGSFTDTAIRGLAALAPGFSVRQFFYDPSQPTQAPHYQQTGELRCRLFRLIDGGSPSDRNCPANPETVDPGVAMLVYVGHGSPWQWASTTATAATPYLFYLYDADGRKNGGRLPIMLSMTCLSGNWPNPYLQSLDERMVLWPNGGAVASVGATGSGVNTGHRRYLEGLIPALMADGSRSLGEAHLAAISQLVAATGGSDLAYSFGILGDPQVQLPAIFRHRMVIPLVQR